MPIQSNSLFVISGSANFAAAWYFRQVLPPPSVKINLNPSSTLRRIVFLNSVIRFASISSGTMIEPPTDIKMGSCLDITIGEPYLYLRERLPAFAPHLSLSHVQHF